MCGRYSLFAPPADVEERFGATFARAFEPRYNMAPGQDLPVVRNDDPGTIRFDHWGLLPPWAESESEGFINARAETLSEKRSFADSFRKRRCLVLADGFYEWAGEEGAKQPYRVAFEDDRPFAMAGLWRTWETTVEQTGLDAFTGGGSAAAETKRLDTFTVVTTEPNAVVEPLHHRMAVVLPEGEERRWLTADPADAVELLEPHPGDEMHAYPVSTAVNDPAHDDPSLVEPLDTA